MNLGPLLTELENATEASERLDAAIALVAGYRPGNNKDSVGALLWRDPNFIEIDRLPNYTSSIDAAATFAREVARDCSWACSWEPGLASAVIAGQPPSQAATPAIAICVAALKLKCGD